MKGPVDFIIDHSLADLRDQKMKDLEAAIQKLVEALEIYAQPQDRDDNVKFEVDADGVRLPFGLSARLALAFYRKAKGK